MDKTDKLEACPFCGGDVTLTTNGDLEGMLRIACRGANCKIWPSTPWFRDAAEVVSLWNTRSRASVAAPPPDVDKELIEAIAQPWICVEERPCEEAVAVHWNEMIEALSAGIGRPSPVAATVDAETPPFSLDDVVRHLNRVLVLLESIQDHKARVILRGLIGHCVAATAAAPSDSSIQAAAAEIATLEKPNHTSEVVAQSECDICRNYKERIAAILSKHSAAVREQWLPIKTAPRDGTRILVARADRVWLDEWWQGDGTNSNWGDLVSWEHAGGKPAQPPTHWMPLPPAPTATPTSTAGGGNNS